MNRFIAICKALSDKTRVRIMMALEKAGGPLCICEIMDTLALPQYGISRHVKELKNAGLVQERKEGRFIFYSLTRAQEDYEKFIVRALSEAEHNPDDFRRLKKRLSLRKLGKCIVGIKKSCCDAK